MKYKTKLDNSTGQLYYISEFKIETSYSFTYKELLYIQYELEVVIQKLKIINKKQNESNR
jgi:hypothetical protein